LDPGKAKPEKERKMSDVNPVNYKIHLEPDLSRFKFKGNVEISLEADKPVHEISLNILELAIENCSAKRGDSRVDCSFTLDPKKEEVIISLPEEMGGTLDLKIEYEGEINDKMAGFYRSKYVQGGDEKYIAVSQFEESDARRAFPCFDHPLKKATFDVEMIIDENLVAISNAPIAEEASLGDGRKLVKFERTPKMSTYLLFLGVGEFEFIEDRGKVLVRAATMPGMTPYARFGLEFGRKSLEFSEDYYGIKYPLPKLDLIAIADFAAGAMENWGAITFRENLLLHYPDITSKAGEERICEVIAHEMAHQWFGNLVTPSDWKYLWLNESFATYFGYGIVTHYYPEWDIWEQFLHGQTNGALDRDALHETFPIEIPGGEHVVITASTAPIIYSKGGSILRQVEGYVGKENFKGGLRHYLKKHEYGCASSHHLWEALEEVSGMPVTNMMKSWIEQPGFPLVEGKRDGDRLLLTQKRFTYLDNDEKQQWLIPVAIKVFYSNGQTERISTLLEGESVHLDVGGDVVAYKINQEQTGFYRVRYLEANDLQALGSRVASKELSQEDRWGIQNDLYAMVRSGHVSIEEYLQFLGNYSKEDAFLPLTSIAGNLFHAQLIIQGEWRDKILSTGKSLLERVLSDIGFEPEPEERHTRSILRDQILWHLALYESEDVLEFATAKFSSLMRGEKLHPDIMRSVMQIGALQGDNSVFEWFNKKLASSESEHERMNMLAALGSFKERELVEKAQQYILDEVPPRNKFVPITYMAANPHAVPYMWAWYRSNLEALEKFHPMHYERVIAAIVPVGGLGREEEIDSFFKEYMAKKEKAKDVIKLSLERLRINSRMKNL
jgi:tricorn protease interacting factor F2/3